MTTYKRQKIDANLFRPIFSYITTGTLIAQIESRDIYIAGGAVLSCILGDKIADIDLFFENVSDFNELKLFLRKNGYMCIHDSDNALTYSLGDEKKLQLIKLSMGNPIESILDSFDIINSRLAYSIKNHELVSDSRTFELLKTSRGMFSDSIHTPIRSISRYLKYSKKGFVFDEYELLKLAMLIKSIKLNHYSDLKDHITDPQYKKITEKFGKNNHIKINDLISFLSGGEKNTDGLFSPDSIADIRKEVKKSKEVMDQGYPRSRPIRADINRYRAIRADINRYYGRVSFADLNNIVSESDHSAVQNDNCPF